MVAALAVAGAVGALTLAPSAFAAPVPVTPTRAAHSHLAAVPGTGAARHNPLLKDVLAEENESNDQNAPITAQCKKFIGKPNPYPDPAPNVDMIVGDRLTSSGSGGGCSTPQNETTIAVNPENPANIVAGANDYRGYSALTASNQPVGYAYTSTDGGSTWTDVLLPGLTWETGAVGPLHAMDAAGDPVVAFGPDNTVYYGNISFSRGAPADGGTEAPNAITVNVSHDGGLSFGEPTIVRLDGADADGNPTPTHFFNDKIWLAADPNSNRVYVTWTRFRDTADGGYAESPIVIATSTDGAQTFSRTRRIDTVAGANNPGLQPFSQGSSPAVGPDGTLSVAYETSYCASAACDRPNDRDVTVVATSTDHGRTFSRSIVGTNYDFPVNDNVGDYRLTGENFRINAFPALTVDPVTGVFIVTWVDDRNGRYNPRTGESIRTNADNIVSSSTDGVAWTRPVSFGSGQDEIFGAVAAFDGTAAITSYTRHYQASNVKLDYAYWSVDAEAGRIVSTGPITRITTRSSNPRIQFPTVGADGHVLQGGFIGDYTDAAMGADKRLHPSWTDFRGNPGTTAPNQDAYTSTIDLG